MTLSGRESGGPAGAGARGRPPQRAAGRPGTGPGGGAERQRLAARARWAGLVLVVLAAAALGARAAGGDTPAVALQDRLALVRENLALLGRALVVCIGAFPADATDDWARELCREPAIMELADRVVFVRHARRRVLDADELWLRERGVPVAWGFEGALVVTPGGSAAALLRRPIALEELRAAIERAAASGRSPAGVPSPPRFRRPGAPAYTLPIPQECEVVAVGAGSADLVLRHRGSGAYLEVEAARFGAAGRRGLEAALAALDERRTLRRQQSDGRRLAVEPLAAGGSYGELWVYRSAPAGGGHGERGAPQRCAEAVLVRGGDLFAVTARAAGGEPAELKRLAEQLLRAIAPGQA
ncbi:MAG: hypothetical protein KatS3mg102_0804 [Planctomycetota bacterium]|nr:MAG: hypothetical protein KatS3mg102_0804 [Planctomycetota bacterium]